MTGGELSAEERAEWRRLADEDGQEFGDGRIGRLLDALDAAEERLAAVRALADGAAIVDGPDDGDSDPRLLAWIDLDRIRAVLDGDS